MALMDVSMQHFKEGLAQGKDCTETNCFMDASTVGFSNFCRLASLSSLISVTKGG